MNKWFEVQKRLSEHALIAEIEMQCITPARIGGYNAQPYSPKLELAEKPRTQAIKGLWRWWARAIIAGAKLSAGQSLPQSLSDLDKEISELFGSTDNSSKFTLQLFVDEEETREISSLVRRVPRIRLLSRRKERQRGERYYYYPKIILTLRANRIQKLSVEEAMFGLSSLLVSLVFSGIGSIVNRGFGKVKIKLKLGPYLKNVKDANLLRETLSELYKNGDELKVKLKKLINKSLEYASAYKRYKKSDKEASIKNIPPYSVLLPEGSPPLFCMEDFKTQKKDIGSILECIGKSTMKSEWKTIRGKSPKSVGKDFHTWVLGLPRSQKPPYEENRKKVNKLTGYILDEREDIRRQSPMGFTILKLEENEYRVVVYGFLTSEYSEKLSKIKHIGIHTEKGHIKGVIGRVKEVRRTNVQDDIFSRGIQTPSRVIRVSKREDTLSIYRKCFEAAYQFVKKIIGRCL